MRPVSIIPPGCQPWTPRCITSAPGFFAYCSTLAIYVYKSTPGACSKYTLHRIIAEHERTITSIAFCPNDPNLLLSCSVDGRILVWDIEFEQVRYDVVSPKKGLPIVADWCSVDSNLLAIASSLGNIIIFDKEKETTYNIYNISSNAPRPTALCFNRNSPIKLAVGSFCGGVWIIFMDGKRKPCKLNTGNTPIGSGKTAVKVVDIQWDPKHSSYLLVAWANGLIGLFDVESNVCLNMFDKVSGGVALISFMPEEAGAFVTADMRTGIIRIWNVSQTNPSKLIKIYHSGILGIYHLEEESPNGSLIVAGLDGSVGVYNIIREQYELMPQANHTETIFDISCNPSEPDIFATCSYDSTVRIWDASRMSCLQVCHAGDHAEELGPFSTSNREILYSVSWDPSGSGRLASSSSTGKIVIWDSKKGTKIKTIAAHNGVCYRVCWCAQDPSWIASCGKDHEIKIWAVSGKCIESYMLPCEAVGADWHPEEAGILAISAGDSIIRIFDVLNNSEKSIISLEGKPSFLLTLGHKMRGFAVQWSHTSRSLLASSSDDKTVRIWSVDIKGKSGSCLAVLEGHSSRVRPILWHFELPYIIASGSWDGSIRVWDIRSKKCLKVCCDHQADVYGLTSHPDRPFSLLSSSRDMSIRSWSFPTYNGRKLAAMSLLKGNLDELVLKGDGDRVMPSESVVQFAGKSSAKLVKVMNSYDSPLDAIERIAQLICVPSSGYRTLFSIAKKIINGQPVPVSSHVLPPEDLLNYSAILAQELIDSAKSVRKLKVTEHKPIKTPCNLSNSLPNSVSMLQDRSKEGRGFMAATKGEERLRRASEMFLYLGDVKRCCEILFHQLGEYERALTLAPAVSIDYWKQLSKIYAGLLAESNIRDSAHYFIASGDFHGAADYLVRRSELEDAYLVSASASDDRYSDITNALAAVPKIVNAERTAMDDTVVEAKARFFVEGCEPVLAASVLLSAGKMKETVDVLLIGNETMLALQLVKLFRLDRRDVYVAAAWYLESLGLRTLAAGLIDPTDMFSLQLLAARAKEAQKNDESEFLSPADIEKLFLECGLRSPDSYKSDPGAPRRSYSGDLTMEYLIPFMLEGEEGIARVAELVTIELIRRCQGASFVDYESLLMIIEVFRGFDLSFLKNDFLVPLISFTGLLAAMKLVELKEYVIADAMCVSVSRYARKHDFRPYENYHFQLSKSRLCQTFLTADIVACEAGMHIDPRLAYKNLMEIKASYDVFSPGMKDDFDRIGKYCKANPKPTVTVNRSMNVALQGMMIPSREMLKKRVVSCITNRNVSGRIILLSGKKMERAGLIDEFEVTRVSSQYAAEWEICVWRKVNMFNPVFDGRTLNRWSISE